MAHDHHAGHAQADDEYVAAPGSSYEHTDADTKLIAKFLVWIFILAVGVHFGIAGAYQLLISRGVSEEAAERRYPLAMQEHQLPPTPRLQQFPQNERVQFQREERLHLQSYGWENKAAGTVHIPIAEAMRLVVERGAVSSRSPEAGSATVPGMMPTDSSAGRVSERRRQ
jgi:hypothetical protein